MYFPKDARTLSGTETSSLGNNVFPELGPGEQWIEDDLRTKNVPSPLWQTSLWVLYGALSYLGISLAILPLTLIFGTRPDVIWVAGIFGLLSTATGIFQFVPQIIFTATTKV